MVEFFRTCEERCLNILSHLGGDDAPWLASTETWLAFARMTIPRGQLYHCSREIPRRSPELAAQVAAIFERNASAQRAWRVELADGGVAWLDEQDGRTVRLASDPAASGWRRFLQGLFGIVAPESLL